MLWVNKTNRSELRHHPRFAISLSLMAGVYTSWTAVTFFGARRSNTVFGQEVISTEERLTRSLCVGQGMAHVEHSIPTILGNRKKFTKRDASTADIVRCFQYVAGYPSDATLAVMFTKRTIKNCPFPPRNVAIATKILGPSVYGLKGKRTRKTKDPVQTEALVPISKTTE